MISLLTSKFTDLTAPALKLLDNAVQYLLSGTQFNAPSLEISTFTVNGVDATISQNPATITLLLPAGTDLTALQPTVVLSGLGTTVSPASGVATNFTTSGTTPVNYTVTDGINSKVYAASITNDATGLTFTMANGISFDGKYIHNNANLDLQVYDATGRIVVSSNKDINMSNRMKGVYFVKSNQKIYKIVLIK
jgi:hypothetical protein